ncbi:hypothetical protein V8E36_007111 [Tilletia maclaganii]
MTSSQSPSRRRILLPLLILALTSTIALPTANADLIKLQHQQRSNTPAHLLHHKRLGGLVGGLLDGLAGGGAGGQPASSSSHPANPAPTPNPPSSGGGGGSTGGGGGGGHSGGGNTGGGESTGGGGTGGNTPTPDPGTGTGGNTGSDGGGGGGNSEGGSTPATGGQTPPPSTNPSDPSNGNGGAGTDPNSTAGGGSGSSGGNTDPNPGGSGTTPGTNPNPADNASGTSGSSTTGSNKANGSSTGSSAQDTNGDGIIDSPASNSNSGSLGGSTGGSNGNSNTNDNGDGGDSTSNNSGGGGGGGAGKVAVPIIVTLLVLALVVGIASFLWKRYQRRKDEEDRESFSWVHKQGQLTVDGTKDSAFGGAAGRRDSGESFAALGRPISHLSFSGMGHSSHHDMMMTYSPHPSAHRDMVQAGGWMPGGGGVSQGSQFRNDSIGATTQQTHHHTAAPAAAPAIPREPMSDDAQHLDLDGRPGSGLYPFSAGAHEYSHSGGGESSGGGGGGGLSPFAGGGGAGGANDSVGHSTMHSSSAQLMSYVAHLDAAAAVDGLYGHGSDQAVSQSQHTHPSSAYHTVDSRATATEFARTYDEEEEGEDAISPFADPHLAASMLASSSTMSPTSRRSSSGLATRRSSEIGAFNLDPHIRQLERLSGVMVPVHGSSGASNNKAQPPPPALRVGAGAGAGANGQRSDSASTQGSGGINQDRRPSYASVRKPVPALQLQLPSQDDGDDYYAAASSSSSKSTPTPTLRRRGGGEDDNASSLKLATDSYVSGYTMATEEVLMEGGDEEAYVLGRRPEGRDLLLSPSPRTSAASPRPGPTGASGGARESVATLTPASFSSSSSLRSGSVSGSVSSDPFASPAELADADVGNYHAAAAAVAAKQYHGQQQDRSQSVSTAGYGSEDALSMRMSHFVQLDPFAHAGGAEGGGSGAAKRATQSSLAPSELSRR